jgi:hypothetical protein
MMPQERPCMVSYCFHSSIIPKECGSGNEATIKINQDGDDAASHPTRRRIKDGDDAASRPTRRRIELAVMLQAVLPDDDSSR